MFTFFGSNVDCLTCMLYVLDFFFFLNKTELKFPASTEGDLKSWVGGWFVALEPFAAGCKPQNEACNLVTPLQKKKEETCSNECRGLLWKPAVLLPHKTPND